MADEFTELYEAYSNFESKLDELSDLVSQAQNKDNVLSDIRKIENIINSTIIACRDLQ